MSLDANSLYGAIVGSAGTITAGLVALKTKGWAKQSEDKKAAISEGRLWIDGRKAESQAFEEARNSYKDIIKGLQEEMVRLREDNRRKAEQILAMQQQLDQLRSMVESLQAQLADK